MNALDAIKELYDLYLEEETSPQIVELKDSNLDLDLDLRDGPVMNRLLRQLTSHHSYVIIIILSHFILFYYINAKKTLTHISVDQYKCTYICKEYK